MDEKRYQEWFEWLAEHDINMKNRAIVFRFDLMYRCCVTFTSEYGWGLPDENNKSEELEIAQELLAWCVLSFIQAEEQEIINDKWKDWAELICIRAIDYLMLNEVDPKETYEVVKQRTLAAYHAFVDDYCYELYQKYCQTEEEANEIIVPLLHLNKK